MLSGIDHLVILVPALEPAVNHYETLGFTVIRGGRHNAFRTHNALIALSDGSYLELLAFYEPNPASKLWHRLVQGGGLVSVCARSDQLEADIDGLRAVGVAMNAPQPMERVRPDGYTLRWRLAHPAGQLSSIVPFLIEDQTPREERVPAQSRHGNGVVGIQTVTIAVDDLAAARDRLSSFLCQRPIEVERPDLNAAGVAFRVGSHSFEILAPLSPVGPVYHWLRAHGPSPFQFTLNTHSGGVFVPSPP